jgi:dinuclear metal center YbgI/SA1388 family protein
MLAEEIITHIEKWAPPKIAWKNDNVGIQVGSAKMKVSNILLSLELTEKVLDEAIKKQCNFIFTHHPFIFFPITHIDTTDNFKGHLIQKLIKNDITLFSAHTNLDYTKNGVSFELAKVLNLKNIQFLQNQNNNQYKVIIFIPEKDLTKVSDAIFNAGGGVIGEYTKCSFSTGGIGTFEGSENSNPAIGKKVNFEKINEIKFEVIVNSWMLNKVIAAIKKTHPYEEPAFDIIPVQNENTNFGSGAIGTLERSMSKNEFLSHVCKKLKADNIRYTNGNKTRFKTIAVCGGSCADMLNIAVRKKADAFITADIKYHTFQEGEDRILFIDAGHYETEIHSLNVVKRELESLIKNKNESVRVIKYSGSTNPIKFFNNKRS